MLDVSCQSADDYYALDIVTYKFQCVFLLNLTIVHVAFILCHLYCTSLLLDFSTYCVQVPALIFFYIRGTFFVVFLKMCSELAWQF